MPTLFIDKGPLRDRLGEALDRARASVHAVPDHEAVGRGRDEWVDALVQRARISPPGLSGGGPPEIESLGRSTRCHGASGHQLLAIRVGNVQRETVNYRATLRFDGAVRARGRRRVHTNRVH